MRKSCLIMVLLCFSSLLIISSAVPVTRTKSLLGISQRYGVSDYSKVVRVKKLRVVERNQRGMEIELNDYPGAGSNNRHTPNPRRGCIDC